MNSTTQDAILEAQDVSFSYSNQKSPLLDHCSLELMSSEILCLLGPSGAGKTTLLKLLAGLLPPSSGTIFYKKKSRQSLEGKEQKKMAQEVAMSFQKGGLLDWLTVEENIEFVLTELKMGSEEERKKIVQRSLDQVGLSQSNHLFLKQLSGGMLKRLSLARAIALSPKVLLLDDPTAGLDPVTGSEIIKVIRRFQTENRAAILLVTSDLSVAFSLATRMGFLWSGRVSVGQSPEEFKKKKDPAIQQFIHGLPEGPLSEVDHA